jgi:23S rRNA (adenine2503-C2)-methyltransferase
LKTLQSFTSEELRQALRAEGLEPFRAAQVLRWVYRRAERDPARMTDLPAAARAVLEKGWRLRALELVQALPASDGATKLVLRTSDGGRVEAVVIPEEKRRTICVSSQIGCSLDCAFCATGRLGLGRNLRAEEIVDQVLHAAELLVPAGERPTHLVYMGMGEPLANLRAVIQSLRILTDPCAFGLAPRRITVSTAGVVPKLAELGRALPVRLAVSLHATTDELRDRLVPLNRRFPLAALLEACRAYPLAPRERLSFEYVLLAGVNDSPDDARRLVRLVAGMRALVNLIPWNPHPAAAFRRPSDAAIEAFAGVLARARVPVAVRRSRGEDVFAACGQLGALAEPAA